MRKIIFLDVDGTLVDYQNRVPLSAIHAIRQARQNGHLVYLCTGRSRAEMQPQLWDIGIDGMIGGNGSYVEHQNQVIMHQCIEPEIARQVVDWLQANALEFYLESNNGLFASRFFREVGTTAFRRYMATKSSDLTENDRIIEQMLGDMIWGGELYRDDLNKISFVLNSLADVDAAKAAFPQLKVGSWGGVGEIPLFVDLGVPNISKAHAIEILLNHLNADRHDTLAFGDAKIDIPMLEYCEIGVAMGNGGKEIKAIADYVTGNVEQDGLYQAFVHFGLIAES